MFSYDIRTIFGIMVFSLFILKLSQIKYSQIRLMIIYVAIFIAINAIITFLFSPEEGVKIYGTRHEIVHLFGKYTLTQEQLFYQLTKLLKYISVIPLGIVFYLLLIPVNLQLL